MVSHFTQMCFRILLSALGLLQTDDKIALAEITRQLQLEAESEGKAFVS
jgi:hypothetical protein